MVDSGTPRHVFREGEHALLTDRRGREYLVRLRSEGEFHSHIGNVSHADLIGKPEGTWAVSARGHRFLAMKPTMADFTRKMPRIATVVYPKDLATVLISADIFPGARVLEAGTGSGALTMVLLRAVGQSGRVISYDLREDMIKQALENIGAMIPDHPNLSVKLGDVVEGFAESEFDRVVLDLPEPWHVVPHASDKLVPGGIFLSFLPTVPQVQQLTEALRSERTFGRIETVEVLERPWTFTGRSVRPSHRMVGHTGFITTARKSSPRPPGTEDREGASRS